MVSEQAIIVHSTKYQKFKKKPQCKFAKGIFRIQKTFLKKICFACENVSNQCSYKTHRVAANTVMAS